MNIPKPRAPYEGAVDLAVASTGGPGLAVDGDLGLSHVYQRQREGHLRKSQGSYRLGGVVIQTGQVTAALGLATDLDPVGLRVYGPGPALA